MTILITGASGLVGARLLPRLVQVGMDCRALVRPGGAGLAGAAMAPGDLLDPASLASAVQGISAVIHLAAAFRTADAGLIWKVNLEGTRNLIAAVKATRRTRASSWRARPTSVMRIPPARRRERSMFSHARLSGEQAGR